MHLPKGHPYVSCPKPQTNSRPAIPITCKQALLHTGAALVHNSDRVIAESSLGPDSHHPIISLSGIPSAVMVLRILHPILASTLCAANPLARIAEPTIAL